MTHSATTERRDLLVIAPAVPRYDCNSGDLRLFSMLRLLASEYRICYLPVKERRGGERYAAELAELGVQVLPEGTPLSSILKGRSFSAALIEFYHSAPYFLPRLRLMQPRCRIILDTVDVHFLREEMMGAVTGDASVIAGAARTKKAELAVYSRCDVVVTVTEDDGAALTGESSGIKVRVVPNIHEIVAGEGAVKEHDLVFVGGFQHQPNADAVLHFCRDILPLVRRELPEVTVTIVGSNPPAEVLALAGETVKVTGFVPSTTPYLKGSRVSIAPMRIGAGMKGKVGEAMAHGIPVVTTSVGAQGMGLAHGVNVMIADDPAGFAAAVVALLTDSPLAERIARSALDHVSRHYTPVQVGKRMKEVLEEVENTPARRLSLADTARFFTGWLSGRIRAFAGG